MKVPLHVVKARRERLAELITQHGYLPVHQLCERLKVSEATARRDLSALVTEKRIKRTYGGAVSESDDRFPSFTERRDHARVAKAQVAAAALALIKPEQTIFLDAGTTMHALAEAFRERPVVPLTIVTSNIPVAELLSGIPAVDVFLLAGQLLHRQAVLLGETARRSLEFWRFDAAFLSAEGMDLLGLWNSREAIVEQQKAVIRRSRRSVFCLDGSKLKRTAPHFLIPWKKLDALLTDVPRKKLEVAGIRLRANQYLPIKNKK